MFFIHHLGRIPANKQASLNYFRDLRDLFTNCFTHVTVQFRRNHDIRFFGEYTDFIDCLRTTKWKSQRLVQMLTMK